MPYSEAGSGESLDEFDGSIHADPQLHRPMHVHITDADTTAQPTSKSSRWVNWYMGAPGTLVGTLLGLCCVEGVRALPFVKALSSRTMYEVGDAVHTVGALYFRALTLMTLPLAFLTVALSVADMMTSKRMFKIRWKIVGLTLLTTLLAIAQAFVAAWLLGPRIDSNNAFNYWGLNNNTPMVLWRCPNLTNPDGQRTNVLVLDNATNELRCERTWAGSVNGSTFDSRLFLMTSVSGGTYVFKRAERFQFSSMADEIINTISNLAPINMMDIVLSNNVVGLVVFAIAFGQAAAFANGHVVYVEPIQLMRELHAIFKTMLSYVVTCTPVAIIPLFAGPFLTGTQTAQDDFPRLGFFVLAFTALCAVHMLVVLPAILFCFTGTNPYKYLFLVKDALAYGISCSSSSTSLPVAIRLMDGTNACDRNIARFTGSIGTGINKNGGAAYIVMALVWTIRNAGLSADLTTLKFGLMCACALVASLAVAPVRTGGLAVVLCVFRQLTGLNIVPFSLSVMVVAECIIDPLSTVVNLWGNLVVSRIVAHRPR
ncbi:hypothetical protein H310_03514 [Aphanomyces invadans]|uniref:Amino acid transporter n=1 Tax=Aphanomyces invadans TaxID=157072 RepID=A0A024UJR3_9STRA|nr:hypothetical protein H310_03514 [Aphanomyces invadans]ETW05853.1 hypothetical protein H310_03514 [Aphanomyces invadans]|eukprot:XP_008865630.1 hypothetical protein H310_03514 [Aphanomyces invadans]